MPWWTWICLGVSLALVLVPLVVALVAVFQFFRALHRASTAAAAVGERLSAGMESLAEASERMGAGTERVHESVAALRDSQERLGVLIWALRDVRRLLRLTRSTFSPAK